MDTHELATKYLQEDHQNLSLGSQAGRTLVQRYRNQNDLQGKIDTLFQAQVLTIALLTNDKSLLAYSRATNP